MNVGLLQIEQDAALPGHSGNQQPGDPSVVRSPEVITAPDTVRVGETFQVVVTTVGPNGCWSAANMTVSVSGLTAKLIPYDMHSGADPCAELLAYLPHRANVRFEETGKAVLRVEAARLVNAAPSQMIAEREVVVIR